MVASLTPRRSLIKSMSVKQSSRKSLGTWAQKKQSIFRNMCILHGIYLSGPWSMSPNWSWEKNDRHFTDDMPGCNFLNEKSISLIHISLKFLRKGPINDTTASVQIMVWHRRRSEPMTVKLYILLTPPQWVKWTCQGDSCDREQIACSRLIIHYSLKLMYLSNVFIYNLQLLCYVTNSKNWKHTARLCKRSWCTKTVFSSLLTRNYAFREPSKYIC